MMPLRSLVGTALVLLCVSTTYGCGGIGTPGQVAQKQSGGLDGGCAAGSSRREHSPLVVALPSTDKAALEARMSTGPMVVQYEDCSLHLLARCRTKGSYRYTPTTLKADEVSARDANELFARLPIGAASLAGTVQANRQLAVAMAIVGRFVSDDPTPPRSTLEGDCDGATHWVTGITVGAYSMASGEDAVAAAQAALFGASIGGRREGHQQIESHDGDGAQCKQATGGETAPPAGCGALLRLDLQPLQDTK